MMVLGLPKRPFYGRRERCSADDCVLPRYSSREGFHAASKYRIGHRDQEMGGHLYKYAQYSSEMDDRASWTVFKAHLFGKMPN
jgi:hypothetical protein